MKTFYRVSDCLTDTDFNTYNEAETHFNHAANNHYNGYLEMKLVTEDARGMYAKSLKIIHN